MLGWISQPGLRIPHLVTTALEPSFSPGARLRMGNVLFAAPTPAVWLLLGMVLIGWEIFSRRFSLRRYRALGRVFRIVLATITFLFFFYSTTFAISLLYALDSAFLNF